MPFINIRTNLMVNDNAKLAIKSALGEAIATIGKSEQWLMVSFEQQTYMYFRGENVPMAMVEVSMYGSASPEALNELTHIITTLISDTLYIDDKRIYVSYMMTPYWGWNGSNL